MTRSISVCVTVLLMTSLLGAGLPNRAEAQSSRLLGSYRDWDAHVRGSGSARECYMLSAAKRWSASRKGVSRGDIYITVTHRPAMAVSGEVNVIVGYPLRQGSELRLSIDGKRRFDLFTEGRGAWAYDSKDDTAIVTAMKRGNTLVATASSQRGTRTTDTYSLSGFTAAYNAITRACG